MSANKRPSTSSLRRYLTSRPYLTVADIRRRFGLDPEAMSAISRNGTTAYVGLPEREASKLQDLWHRDEIGVELSVEVRAPVVVGIYPMRIARFVLDQAHGAPTNGHAPGPVADGDPAGSTPDGVRSDASWGRPETNGHRVTGPGTSPPGAGARSADSPASPARDPGHP